MKATITLQQLWFNDASLAKFFFRQQALDTFGEIVRLVHGDVYPNRFEELSDAVEGYYTDLDEFEDDCYNLSAQEIIDQLEIEQW